MLAVTEVLHHMAPTMVIILHGALDRQQGTGVTTSSTWLVRNTQDVVMMDLGIIEYQNAEVSNKVAIK